MAVVPPESLKSLHSYLKLAADTDARDPVLAYWIRFFVVNKAMKLDRSSPDAVKFLMTMMDILEKGKAELRENEAVTQDMVAQAHVENYGTKLFDLADREDREANATLKTVKAYLAANQVFEVLSVFAGGLSEEVTEKQKYAKYRASVIMKAVKAGEPVPLPENLAGNLENTIGEKDPFDNLNRAEPSLDVLPPAEPCDEHKPVPPPASHSSPSKARLPSPPRETHEPEPESKATASNGAPLSPLSIEKAQKYCKYAGSALLYDDVPTAIDNLEKALSLLKTGHFPG